ncbi:MAG: DegV family protein [Agathobacter sp.]|nr:DegV family protein [Agathobacter sp.]
MVHIVADSTCDLSKELVERYGITVVPLNIVLGDEEHADGVDITPDEIFRWADENKTTPKTSAPPVERVIEVYQSLLQPGDEAVVFSISESMSSANAIFHMAATMLDEDNRIYVIDSKNLSTGIGLLVIEAAILAKEGEPAEQIVKKINELVPRVRASFVVDTLVYLHRGGRCSGLSAMLGSTIKLHPRIVVENGVMHSDKKYRGTMQKVLLSYAEDLEEAMRRAKKDRVFITHSGSDAEIVDAVRDYLKSLQLFDEILETRAGGVVSSHCGPGTLGVLFIE